MASSPSAITMNRTDVTPPLAGPLSLLVRSISASNMEAVIAIPCRRLRNSMYVRELTKYHPSHVGADAPSLKVWYETGATRCRNCRLRYLVAPSPRRNEPQHEMPRSKPTRRLHVRIRSAEAASAEIQSKGIGWEGPCQNPATPVCEWLHPTKIP